MSKITIECPHCGSINTASNFWGKKIIRCGTCDKEINIKNARLTSKACPSCGKIFVYDQMKSHNRKCPSCGEKIDATTADTVTYKMITVNCPQCACAVEVDRNQDTYLCPICECKIDVKKELARAELVNNSHVSVIQYEGDHSMLVWKHPLENFNFGSQLIVHESQEAIFFLNGQALDTFSAGRYTLKTENLPILKKIYNISDNETTPFHAEVYFINKAVQMGMKWGTDSRVRFIDPETGLPFDIGASGELNLQVVDSRKLLIKLVGTTLGLSNKDVLSSANENMIHKTLKSYFRAPLMTEIKSYLATVIGEKRINILEFDQHIAILSQALRERISPKFEEFGIAIPQFYITTIALPEDDKNFKQIKELMAKAYLGVKTAEIGKRVALAEGEKAIAEEEIETQRKITRAKGEAELKRIQAEAEAEAKRVQGLAEAEVMRAKGYSEKDLIAADVQKAYADGIGAMGSNSSSNGNVVGDIVNAMLGIKMAGTVVDKMDNMMSSQQKIESSPPAVNTWACDCGETGNVGKFCMNCGKARVEDWICTACGHLGNHGKFCEGCGMPKSNEWTCSHCGKGGNKGKFCAECGNPKE